MMKIEKNTSLVNEVLALLLAEEGAAELPPYLSRELDAFASLSRAQQERGLVALYLLLEQYLTQAGRRPRYTAAHLRGVLRLRIPELAERADFRPLFAELAQQEELLGRMFLRAVITHARSPDRDLAALADWLGAWPPVLPIPALAGTPQVSQRLPANEQLAAVSAALFTHLGEGTAAERAFENAFTELEYSYARCEGFPAVLALLPARLLDAERALLLAKRAREHALEDRLRAAQRTQDELLDRIGALEHERSKLLVSLTSTSPASLESTLLDSIAEAVLTVDSIGTVRMANSAARLLFGGADVELVGRPLADLFLVRENDRGVAALFRFLHTGSPEVLGDRLILQGRRNGSTFPARLRVMEAKGTRERLYTIVVRDISDRRDAEARLRLQGAALEGCSAAIAIAAPNGRIEWANKAFARLTGWEAQVIAGRSLLELEADVALSAPSGHESWSGDRRYRRADGTTYVAHVTLSPVRDDDGELQYIVSSHDDVTRHYEAVTAFARAEGGMRALVERSPDALLVCRRSGAIAYANAAAQRYLGHPSLVGLSLMDILSPEDRAHLLIVVGTLREGDMSYAGREHRLIRADGSIATADVAALALEFGGEGAVVLTARDITARVAEG